VHDTHIRVSESALPSHAISTIGYAVPSGQTPATRPGHPDRSVNPSNPSDFVEARIERYNLTDLPAVHEGDAHAIGDREPAVVAKVVGHRFLEKISLDELDFARIDEELVQGPRGLAPATAADDDDSLRDGEIRYKVLGRLSPPDPKGIRMPPVIAIRHGTEIRRRRRRLPRGPLDAALRPDGVTAMGDEPRDVLEGPPAARADDDFLALEGTFEDIPFADSRRLPHLLRDDSEVTL